MSPDQNNPAARLDARRASAKIMHSYTADEFTKIMHRYAAGEQAEPAGGYVAAPLDGADICLRGLKHDALFRLQGFFIDTGLDLRDSRFGSAVEINDCTIAGTFDATDTRITGSFLASNSWIGNFEPGVCTPKHLLSIMDDNDGDYDHKEVARTSSMRLFRSRIEGNCEFKDLYIAGHLGLAQASIYGDLIFETSPAATDPLTVTGIISARGLTTAGGISMTGVTLNGALDLANSETGHEIVLASSSNHRCRVDGDIFLYEAKLGSSLELVGIACTGYICMNGAVITGYVGFHSTADQACEINDAGGTGASIGSNFTCTALHVGKGIVLSNSRIDGTVTLSPRDDDPAGCKMGYFYLAGCTVGESVLIKNLELEEELILGKSDIKNKVRITENRSNQGTTFHRGLNFSSITVGDDFIIEGIHVRGHITMVGARASGVVVRASDAGNICHIKGDFNASQARFGGLCMESFAIGGNLNLGWTTIEGFTSIVGSEECRATVAGKIDAHDISASNQFHLHHITITGSVDLQSASIAGDLLAWAMLIGAPESPAPFNAPNVTVRGHMHLQITTHGDLNLYKVSAGKLSIKSISNDKLCNIGGTCSIDYASIDSDLAILGATISGNLSLNSAKVKNSLHIESQANILARIGGDLFGVSCEITDDLVLIGVAITGQIGLWRAQITGQLCLSCTSTRGCLIGNGVNLTDSRIGNLQLEGVEIKQQPLTLTGTKMDSLWIGDGIIDAKDGRKRQLPTQASAGIYAYGVAVAGFAVFCGLMTRHINFTNATFGELSFFRQKHLALLLTENNLSPAIPVEKVITGNPVSVQVEGHVKLHNATINGDLSLGNIATGKIKSVNSSQPEEQQPDSNLTPLIPGLIDLSNASIDGNIFTGLSREDISLPSEECIASAQHLRLDQLTCTGDVDLGGIRIHYNVDPESTIPPTASGGWRDTSVWARSANITGSVNFIPPPDNPENCSSAPTDTKPEPLICGPIDFGSAEVDEIKLNGRCPQEGDSATPLQIQFTALRRLLLGALSIGLAALFVYAFYLAFNGWSSARTTDQSIVPWIGLCSLTAYLFFRIVRLTAFFCVNDNTRAYSGKSDRLAGQSHWTRFFTKTPYKRQIEKAGFQDLVQVLSLNILQRPKKADEPANPPVLNLSGARIDHLSIFDPMPAPMNIRDLNVSRLTYDDHEIDYEAWLSHGCEFDRANYTRIESMLHGQGENESADRVHRAMHITEQYLNRDGIKTALRLIHSVIGYGTRRARVLLFMLVWFAFTTWWFSDVYVQGLTIDPVIAIEALGNDFSNKDTTLDALAELSDAVTWSRPSESDTPLQRWAISAAIALRYHLPIIDLNMVPLIKPYGTLLTYAEIVRIISWILWPLMIASLLPLLLPKRE